jgi:ATP-dependent RNA helicase DDX10/DBP4
MLKLKGKGTKLVFDDNGEAHEIYELEDENDFHKRGTAESQRVKFLEEEAARIRKADMDDKELVKEKKRERREKRKAREIANREDDNHIAPELLHGEETEDPLALLASLPIDDSKDAPPQKKPKKWFEDDSEDVKKKIKRRRHVIEEVDEPETLEGLEALAAGLLG